MQPTDRREQRQEQRRAPRAAAPSSDSSQWSIGHFARVLWYRKLIVLATFVVVSALTVVFSARLKNSYTSETVIQVDPQKVPEAYVKSTVTGDVRNRLGTLSQQILSVTRLQKIVESLNLYPEERKKLAREDVIALMRKHITVKVISDSGSDQDLQAFRISFSGNDPKLVANVANQLAALFIEENLKAREQQAAGTTEFLENQLVETRKLLEAHEAKLRDFRLGHIGAMPEHETATLQILGQMQSQLQAETDALSRAQQQKTYIQSLMVTQSAPVVDMDGAEPLRPARAHQQAHGPNASPAATRANQVTVLKDRLTVLLNRYSEQHPDVKRLRWQIAEEEKKLAKAELAQKEAAPAQPAAPVATAAPPPSSLPAPTVVTQQRQTSVPVHVNPVLESQLKLVEAEIAKHIEEKKRLSDQVMLYQNRLESIPVHEQQISSLQRDYEMTRTHYKQLLEKQLAAETATQLELRQKAEKFTVLDPAQPAEKPSSPNRMLINAGGCVAGFALGLVLALITELLGLTITAAEQISVTFGMPVFEVIPVIETVIDRQIKRRRRILAFCSMLVVSVAAGAAALLMRHRG